MFSVCNSPTASKFQISCLSYIFVNLSCNINCNRITHLSHLEYVTLLSTPYGMYRSHAHIRLAPQTSDLFIHSLSFTPRSNAGADSRQVNLCWVLHNRVSFYIIAWSLNIPLSAHWRLQKYVPNREPLVGLCPSNIHVSWLYWFGCV